MTLSDPARLNCAVYCTPTLARPPPSTRSQPEYLSTSNRLLVSNTRLCASSFGNFPMLVSLGRSTTWENGPPVYVPPHDPTKHGSRCSPPATGMAGTSPSVPVAIKFDTPGELLFTETVATSPRMRKNGVIIWPLSVINVRRQSACAEKRVYSPGMPRSRQFPGTAVSAGGLEHAPGGRAGCVFASQSGCFPGPLVR